MKVIIKKNNKKSELDFSEWKSNANYEKYILPAAKYSFNEIVKPRPKNGNRYWNEATELTVAMLRNRIKMRELHGQS